MRFPLVIGVGIVAFGLIKPPSAAVQAQHPSTAQGQTPNSCSNPGTSTDRPNNHFPIHPNGTLVKVSNDATVFLIDGGRKRGITSQAVLNNLYPNGGFGNNDVITIASDELAFYSPGNPISAMLAGNGRTQPDGRLISNGSEISIVSNNGNRRPFSTPTRFQNLGYQFCNVVTISASDYNNYPAGLAVGDFPALNSPGDGSAGQPATPTLSWSPVANASSYIVAVATNPSSLPFDPGPITPQCPGCSIITTTPGTSFTLPALNPNTQYFWEIEALNFPDSSVWSAVSSFTTAPSDDQSYGNDKDGFGSGDSPGSNAGINDDSLNTATGNFNYQLTDMVIPGRGLDFVFGRSYNAKDPTSGPLGPGWSHSFNLYLSALTSETTKVHYGDGKVLIFYNGGAGAVSKPLSKGYYDTLTRNGDNTWTLLKPDQKEYHFDSFGRLAYIQDRNGNRITLNYNNDGTLGTVIDTVGRQFVFSYASGLLVDVTDPINRHLQFQYTNGRLSQFRDAKTNPDSYTYDGNGRLVAVFDARTVRRLFNSYDGQGRLISQSNGRTFQWFFTYDDVNHITRVTDPNQKQIIYNHNSGNNLLGFTNRVNSQTTITYDGNNNRQSVSDLNGGGAQFLYNYDPNGNVTQSTDPTQARRQFSYDAKNNPISAVDELTHGTAMGYDARGNLVTLSDALSRASSITYNSLGQPTAITDPNQHITNLTYDAQGNLRTIQDPMSFTTTFDYDAVGRRVRVTNGRGKVTTYGYDNNDNLISVQRPIGVTIYGYDQVDNLISITDPNQNLTRYEYDANNNRTRETDPLNNVVQNTYDSLDRLVATRDKRGNSTSFEYDAEGRMTSVTDAMTNKTFFTYDGNGNKLTSTDANNQTTRFTYDTLNRLKSAEDPLHNLSTKDYDAAGRLMRETDARGNVTQFTYDEVNNLIRVVDAESGTTEYSYDNNHNLRTQKDPRLQTSTLNYDADDRLSNSSDPLGNLYSYSYDAVGNRVFQTDAKHQTIQFTYDDDDRLTRISYPDSTSVQMAYDANGNLTQVVDALGTTTYSYDQLNRVRNYTDVFGKTISYGYDENGNVLVLTYPDGKQVNYVYDASNRMISFTDWGGKTVGYQYNSINLLTRITPPASSDNGATTYTYDLAGRLAAMVNLHTRGGGNSYNFTLDANGNRILSNVQEPLNNRVATTSQSYGYDSANRIQFAGGAGFSFDANGNMTSKADGVTTNYTYDFNDRLINDQTNTYFYNGQGVRVAKSQAGVQTRYIVDVNRELSQVLCETDSGGNITSYYVYGQGLVYKVLPNGTHYYYQFDPNGSTVSMTTEGDFYVNRYTYDPYGKITNRAEVFPNTNTTVSNPFQFGGRFGLMDEGNGLVYVRARYYVPELGRFLTKDPLTGDSKDSGSLNRYLYALDNPVRFADADGLSVLGDTLNFTGDVIIGGISAWSLSTSTYVKNTWVDPIDFYTGRRIGFVHRKLDYLESVQEASANLILRGTARQLGVSLSDQEAASQAKDVVKWTDRGAAVLSVYKGLRDIRNLQTTINVNAMLKRPTLIPAVTQVYEISEVIRTTYNTAYSFGEDTAPKSATKVNTAPSKATKAQPGPILPRGPAVKVMPRGPAPTPIHPRGEPIMPRGPKPTPISPRGTQK